VPITVLGLLAIGLGWLIVSISVGEKKVEDFRIEGTGEVQELIGGIPQLDDRLGDDGAPVTLTLFTDVQCGRCAIFQADVIDPLIEQYVRTGDAQMLFRNFPLGLKPVTLGGIANEAAAEQDRQWQYAEIFLRNLGQVPPEGITKEYIDEVAGAVPKLDVTAWEDALDDPAAEDAANADVEQATALRLSADPAVVVEGPAGSETLQEAPTLDEITAAIDRVG
jgi:protein-disulfide isomerase